jgi:hypothetical protein
MKRFILSALIILSVFSGAISQTTLLSGHVSLGGAMTLEPSDISENWHKGLNLNCGLVLNIRPNFGILSSLDYYRFGFSESYDNYAQHIYSGNAISIISLTVDLKAKLYRPPTNYSPYILMGGGWMSVSSHHYDYTYSNIAYSAKYDDELVPAIDFGMGFDFLSTRGRGFFIEAKYVEGMTKIESIKFIPLRIGILF